MVYNYLSKLPVWVRPLPPVILLCAFVAVGYGIQQRRLPSSAETFADTPASSSGHQGVFTAPDENSQQPTITPSAPKGLDTTSNSASVLNQPLKLSKEGEVGKALEKFRNSPLAKSFGKALEDQKQGRMDQAIQGYRDVLHQMPGALPAELNLAVAYLQNKQPAKAIPHLQVVAKADPNNVNIQFELAKVLASQKRLDDALTPLRRVIKLMPQNPQPRVLMAQIFYTQKNYSAAFDQWTALDKIDAGRGQAAHTAGVIAAENLKDPQKALPWLRKAHRLAPYNDETTLLLAQVLAGTGNTKEAEPLLAKMAKKSPKDAGIRRILASVQWDNGSHDAAISSLRKVISLDPSDKDTKVTLARALSGQADNQAKEGKLAAASGTWKQVEQLYPKDQLPLIKQAEIKQKQGHDSSAKKLYQQVLQKTPNDVNALLGVAGIAMKQKDYGSAYSNFWRVIQVEPKFAPAYGGFVTAAAKTNQEKDAYLLLQGWLKKHPHLAPAQKALQALTPAANKPPTLTPINPNTGTADINTNRPPTLTSPPKATPTPKPQPKPSSPPAEKPAPTTDKPQMTPAGTNIVKSRISPLKPEKSKTAPPKRAPEPTVPKN